MANAAKTTFCMVLPLLNRILYKYTVRVAIREFFRNTLALIFLTMAMMNHNPRNPPTRPKAPAKAAERIPSAPYQFPLKTPLVTKA